MLCSQGQPRTSASTSPALRLQVCTTKLGLYGVGIKHKPCTLGKQSTPKLCPHSAPLTGTMLEGTEEETEGQRSSITYVCPPHTGPLCSQRPNYLTQTYLLHTGLPSSHRVSSHRSTVLTKAHLPHTSPTPIPTGPSHSPFAHRPSSHLLTSLQ